MEKKKKIEKMGYKIARGILNSTISTTAWTFDFLVNIGVLTAEAFLNPSVYADLPHISFGNFSEEKEKIKLNAPIIKQSIRRLRKAGFVTKRKNKYFLTRKGKELARYITGRKNLISRKWDKKYRVVIFDIPEKNKKMRDWLRMELAMLNYKKLQESVYIGKFPLPPDLIESLKSNQIGSYVNYLLVDKVYQNVGIK